MPQLPPAVHSTRPHTGGPSIGVSTPTQTFAGDPLGFEQNPYDPANDPTFPPDIACFVTVGSSTSLLFPNGGYGETTAEKAQNLVGASVVCTLVYGLLIDDLPAAASTIDIRTEDDATSIYEFKIPTTIAPLPHVVLLPKPLAIFVPWGVKCGHTDFRARIHFTIHRG